MNRNDLVDVIAAAAEITKAEADKALAGFLGAVEKSLKKGDSVIITGFGSFSVNKRAARKGRNPKTGQEIKIPAKKVVKFKAGKSLATTVA